MLNYDYLVPLLLSMISLLVFSLLSMIMLKLLRSSIHNKTLILTQKEVQEIRRIITNKTKSLDMDRNKNEQIRTIIEILSLYNELSIGIGERLYDEKYVRVSIGYEMMDFYKNNYHYIMRSDPDIASYRFLSLELLLKKWDDDYDLGRISKMHRRYL